MNNKSIYLLIGQKGSGKSFIGAILDKEFGIKFIRVEDWAKQIKKDRDIDNDTYLKQVFAEIENGIRRALHETDKLVFESTGLTEYFDAMFENLRRDFHVTTIGVNVESNLCLERIKRRDQTIHINVSDDQVLMINNKVREKNFKTDFTINNENKTTQELVAELKEILSLSINK
ncbi:MAG: hypothetical protein K1X90_02730 [Candidatus Kapabacteria bacterium]|nr:hypothetical protein [Candidatus Kapabacteria bacterium]